MYKRQIFAGDKDKWIEAAYTLIARFNLHKKDYAAAISAANSGISSASGDMQYINHVLHKTVEMLTYLQQS